MVSKGILPRYKDLTEKAKFSEIVMLEVYGSTIVPKPENIRPEFEEMINFMRELEKRVTGQPY